MEVTPELARTVAHICGDGYLATATQRRSVRELLTHPRKNMIRQRWFVRYVNTDSALIQQFTRDVKHVFNIRVVNRHRKHEYEVSSKKIYYLIKGLGAGKSRDWFIAKEIQQGNPKIRAAWLQALFDDEAYVSTIQKRIVLNMVNHHPSKKQKLASILSSGSIGI
ncbi:hypothetical protein HY490_00825 [Candidatus Woesearchaeota archaeon]|nr:hypothetical protein [Candidatus Woesearchaeota archaeon]